MDKIAAYELVLENHPLWEKAANYVVVPPAIEMMSDGQLEAEHRRIENLKEDPLMTAGEVLSGAFPGAVLGALAGRFGGGGLRGASIGAVGGGLAGGALGAKNRPLYSTLGKYRQGKVKREQDYRKSLKEPSQEYRIMPVES